MISQLKSTTILFTFLLCILACPAQAENPTPPIVEPALAHTLLIHTHISFGFNEEESGDFTGSGVLINAEKGIIVTNAHVAGRSPSSIMVQLPKGPFVAAHKIYIDPFLDIAFLSAELHPSSPDPVLDCSVPLTLQTPLFAIGHPYNIPFQLTTGESLGTTVLDFVPYLHTSLNAVSGFSGSGVYSTGSGKMVGLATGVLDAEPQHNYSIPSADVCRLYNTLLQNDSLPHKHLTAFHDNPFVFYTSQSDASLKVAKNIRQESSCSEVLPGDILTSINDHPLFHVSDVLHAIQQETPYRILLQRHGVTHSAICSYSRTSTYEEGILINHHTLIGTVDPFLSESLHTPPLGIHSERPNALLLKSDFILSINDVTIPNLSKANTILQGLKGTIATFQIMRFNGPSNAGIFQYLEVNVPIETIEIFD